MDPEQIQTQTPQNKFLIPLSIVVAGAMMAGAIYFGGGKSATPTNTVADPSKIEVAKVTADEHIRGNLSADVVIVEYSDPECPFCKTFHNTMIQLMSNYGPKVAWVYRQFPIAQLHSKAPKEAEATECVAELGGNLAFWSYLDKIFVTTNSNDSLDPAQLPILAASVDVDQTKFNTCLSSGKYTDKIKTDIKAAYDAGARGTPYTVLIAKNGTKVIVNGAEPIDMVKAKIDALLK